MPRIPQQLIDGMIAHAREEGVRALQAAPDDDDVLPNEVCGMVHAGGILLAVSANGREFYASDGVPTAVHRVENGAASPYRYEMAPLRMMQLEQQRDDTGETLFAIYHSHVASAAYPSQTDVRMAFFPPGEVEREPMYPDTFYIVISMADESAPDVRAYRIRQGGTVEEEPIEVS